MVAWFRSWHGAPTDTKWLGIARKSKAPVHLVISTAWALMDYASQEEQRGSVEDFDPDNFSAFLGVECEEIQAVIEAMRDKGFIENGRLANWDEYQPEREDNSTERVKKYRAMKRTETQCNADETQVKRNETQSNAPERDKDTDTEEREREEAREALPSPAFLELLGPEKNISISPEKLKALETSYTSKTVQDFIGQLSRFKKSSGKQYADDGATLEAWIVRDGIKPESAKPPAPQVWMKCLDCEEVHQAFDRCPKCGSKEIRPMIKREVQNVSS